MQSAGKFVAQVRSRMTAVAEVYRRVVFQEQSSELADSLGEVEAPDTPEHSYSQIMQRLEIDSPQWLKRVAQPDISQHARRNLSRFLSSAATSSERYTLLQRSAQAVERALQVFECSEYLTDSLVRHPPDIDLLRDYATAESDSVASELRESTINLERAQSALRQQFRRKLFRTTVSELFTRCDIWQLLAEYSDAADQALRDSLEVVGSPAGFAVMALGRLGSREFDILSDADVLFVGDESANQDECRRAAERVMALLTAYTRDGTAFPIDTRLRPQGTQGDLVTACRRLTQYFSREARPWEAISYLRLRFVAGSRETAERVVQAVREGIGEVARRSSFATDLAEMRRRLDESDGDTNFKTGPGGTYDIDFLAGRLQAEHSVWTAANLASRIAALQDSGLIPPEQARELSDNAAFLRSLEHYGRLVTGRAGKWLPAGDHAVSCVAKLMIGAIDNVSAPSLRGKLMAVLSRNREIYLECPF